MNVPLEDSSKRYREALDFILQAWTCDGRMSFNGAFYKAENYTPFPGVVQKPTPPVYVSTVSPETFPYAGGKNLNIGLVLFAPGIEAIPANVAAYKQALRAGGFDPAKREVMGITQMYCAENERAAVDDGVRYAENYHRFFIDLVVAVRGPGDPFAEIMSKVSVRAQNENNQTLLGSPEALIEKIARMRDEWHVDYLQFEVAQGGLPPDKVRQVLRLFAEKVMPHFK
jgi:alkanesulfonate monooxygenase SsuD/methylene tetrahydromethanopterin reductase-like flavin-dependent oxidoreductase (luciferase family)